MENNSSDGTPTVTDFDYRRMLAEEPKFLVLVSVFSSSLSITLSDFRPSSPVISSFTGFFGLPWCVFRFFRVTAVRVFRFQPPLFFMNTFFAENCVICRNERPGVSYGCFWKTSSGSYIIRTDIDTVVKPMQHCFNSDNREIWNQTGNEWYKIFPEIQNNVQKLITMPILRKLIGL